MSSNEKIIVYTLIALVILAVVLALFVRSRWSKYAQERAAFSASMRTLGLTQSAAPIVGKYHWLGTWNRHKVVVGFYQNPNKQHTLVVGSGILLVVHSGKLPDKHVLVYLSQPPKYVGKSQPYVESRLNQTLLEDAARLPNASLFCAEGLVKGATEDTVIRSHPQTDWTGISMRVVLAKESTLEQIEEILGQMVDWLDRF